MKLVESRLRQLNDIICAVRRGVESRWLSKNQSLLRAFCGDQGTHHKTPRDRVTGGRPVHSQNVRTEASSHHGDTSASARRALYIHSVLYYQFEKHRPE
jgi:hypothetical protein